MKTKHNFMPYQSNERKRALLYFETMRFEAIQANYSASKYENVDDFQKDLKTIKDLREEFNALCQKISTARAKNFTPEDELIFVFPTSISDKKIHIVEQSKEEKGLSYGNKR